jgi:hypothetical protein
MGDVRMIQRCQRPCFSCEPRQSIRVERKRIGEHFDRHVAIQLRVARAIYLAHAAGAERAHDFIGAYLSPGAN